MQTARCLRPFEAQWNPGHLAGGLLLIGWLLSNVHTLAQPVAPVATGLRWWKGNIHTHSLWSDGDDYPEMVVDWYQTHGYNFLALSDHNIVASGVKWITVATNTFGLNAFLPGTNGSAAAAHNKYLRRFGPAWVERRIANGKLQVQLRTFAQFRPLFDQPNRFLLLPSEEITTKGPAVHLNALNLKYLIKPRTADTVLEILQKDVDAVLQQRQETGQPMLVQINHPNYGWAVKGEDLMRVKGARFFEVFNGHHQDAQNEGDATHASIERMWDIALTQRFTQEPNPEPLYGLAVDDAHNYHIFATGKANPGRGWIMVHAGTLTAENLIRAMEAGEFYASTGVVLREVTRTKDRYQLVIQPEPGITYTTTFFGTRIGFDPKTTAVLSTNGQPLDVTRRYSPSVGAKLAEVTGPLAIYSLRGDEIYVRATVTSSKPKANPYIPGEVEKAWTQPLIPIRRK